MQFSFAALAKATYKAGHTIANIVIVLIFTKKIIKGKSKHELQAEVR